MGLRWKTGCRLALLLAATAVLSGGCNGGEGGEDVPAIPIDDADGVETTDDGDVAPTCRGDATLRDGTCVCDGQVCGDRTTCRGGRCVVDVAESCSSKGAWSPGTTAFQEASEEWNLPEIGADGVRISVTEVDGDGWPDLAIRKTGGKPNSFGADGNRQFWLLRNNEGEGFEDVTKSSNILATRRDDSGDEGRPAEVVVWGDVDNDGDLDAYTGFNRTKLGRNTSEIMLNEGDGTFRLGPESNELRRTTDTYAPAGATFLDYNRDGDLDLWVTQYQQGRRILQDHLYRGDGSGGFDEVTSEVGLETRDWGSASIDELDGAEAHSRSWGSNACDLNGDGLPELLSSSYGRAPNHLWRATSSGDSVAYENISVASGYAYDDGMDWTDNEFARCHCKLNPNDPGCDKVDASPNIPCEDRSDVQVWSHDQGREKFRLGGNTGTTVCADLDRDGGLDLINHEIRHWWAGSSSDPTEILYNREGSKIRFDRPGRQATGLERSHDMPNWDEGDITGGVLDFDNDGRPDLYIGSTDYPGTRGLLFHQTSDGTYRKVSRLEGIDHKSSHGLALADFDRDGDVDVVAGHSRARCGRGNHCYAKSDDHVRLFENEVGASRNWVQLKLAGGSGSNRSAIGARITVETEDWERVLEVGGGHGHYGMQHSLVQQLGLGEACRAEVTVRWPDASETTQTFVLKSGHRYRLVQGADPAVVDQQ